MGASNVQNVHGPGGTWKVWNPFQGPKITTPKAPPAPVDDTEAYFRELSRAATDRQLRQGSGRTNAFSFTGRSGGEAYRAPGTKTTLGG